MDNTPTRVLIVESDADEASIIGTYLGEGADHAGRFAPTQAPRLSTALHLLAQREFDAILIDLVLPQTVGLEGFAKIRRMKPSTPVIVLTGLKDVPLAVQAVKRGAYDYFIKGSRDCCLIGRAIGYALERKRLAEAIEGLIRSDDVPNVVVDGGGIVRYANPATRSAFGRAAEDLIDKPFGHPLPDGDGEASIPAPKAPGKTLGLRLRSISWNGEQARLITLRDADGAEQLNRFRAEIKEGLRVTEVKNHFMGRVSHELRNTLSTLTTAAFCLKDGIGGSLSPQQKRLVDIIARNVDRQTKIVANILDLARFQSGKLKIQFRSVDVKTIIGQIVEECRLSGAAAALEVDADRELPPIEGDPDLIAQVLRNLIDNASRFAKSKIVVAASHTGTDGVSISVVDDGAGIPAERLGALFTDHVQPERPANAAAAGAAGYKGTGLGLTICKEIIDGHHGRIWAESEPGQGARFRMVAPAVRPGADVWADERVAAAAPCAGPLPAGKGRASIQSGHK